MLMFDNGLLASFIPEILMVLAYFLCLFAPNFKNSDSTEELTPIVAQISVTQQIHSNTYSTTVSDFQCSELNIIEDKNKFIFTNTDSEKSIAEFVLKLSDALTFKQFSRPPPDTIS